MTALDTEVVVIDVVTRWRIDAAISLVAGIGFFAAGAAAATFARAVLSFVIGFIVGTLLERISSTLPSSDRLADAGAVPDGARRTSLQRYVAETLAGFAVFYGVLAVAIWAWAGPQVYGWLGGWLAAHGIARLYGAARARGIERSAGVVLLTGVGSWRKRTSGYYTTRRPF